MDYNNSQNPNSHYSNSQNPSGSYLKNQNPPPPPVRVAKANKSAKSTNKNFKKMSDKEIFQFVWPGGEMTGVKLKPYDKNLNPLVSSFGYGAWTQSHKLIYYYSRAILDQQDKPLGHYLPYILRHEGLHVIQFKKKKKPPDSFFEMLEFEVEAYSKTHEWVVKEGRNIWTNSDEFDQIEKEARDFADDIKKIMQLYTKGKISAYFSKTDITLLRTVAKYYKEDVEEFIKIRNTTGPPIKGELLAQILQIRYDGLPMFKKKNNKYLIYTPGDMYLVGKSKADKKRFAELGYPED